MKSPECCERDTFITWLGTFMPGERPTMQKFCEDCTREYQTDMKAQNRCENPDYRPEQS